MNRAKKLYLLLGLLVVACVVTFAVSRYETQKENIRTSGEVVLEISGESATTLSWECDDVSFAFHKEDGQWLYDEDGAFPVDQEEIATLLEQFQAFGAAFTIEGAEDLGQYGLDDPQCTIQIGTEEEDYTILLGDYSSMDSQRYVSIGDGNVYLAAKDPLSWYDVELSDLIQNDEIPQMDQVTSLRFSGACEGQVVYQAEGGGSYREDDVYYFQDGNDLLPLDTERVDSYLRNIKMLGLTDYVTYNATQEELEACGLDDPQLTVELEYTWEDEDGAQQTGTLTLYVSRDPEELAAAQAETEAETEDTEDTEEEEITAYLRVGESPILYQIKGEDYTTFLDASYDAFRHLEVLPAEFADISQIDISLEGEDYTITTQGEGEERTYHYQDEELDIQTLQSELEELEADSFTDEQPAQKEEIRLTLHLALENEPVVTISLYRYDGTLCLAQVDGQTVSLVKRSGVVDLIEAVNAIVLS